MNIYALRRTGGILLVAVWAQVATANAVPCTIACLLEAEHFEHDHSPTAPAHPSHHSLTPTVSGQGGCATPQIVVITALQPAFPLSPVTDAPLIDRVLERPTLGYSVVARLDPPPPRSSIIV